VYDEDITKGVDNMGKDDFFDRAVADYYAKLEAKKEKKKI